MGRALRGVVFKSRELVDLPPGGGEVRLGPDVPPPGPCPAINSVTPRRSSPRTEPLETMAEGSRSNTKRK